MNVANSPEEFFTLVSLLLGPPPARAAPEKPDDNREWEMWTTFGDRFKRLRAEVTGLQDATSASHPLSLAQYLMWYDINRRRLSI